MLLSEKQLNEVKGIIDRELIKRGFPVLDVIREVETRNGSRLEFNSKPFNTTPAIYRSCCVTNFSSFLKENINGDNPFVEIYAEVSCSVKSFGGGSNCPKLFSVDILSNNFTTQIENVK